MPGWIISIIQIGVGALLTLAVQFWSSHTSRWKLIEDRKTEYAKRREPLYTKALELIFAIEASQTNTEELDKNLRRLTDWLFGESFLLPPNAKEVLFELRVSTINYLCDMQNRQLEKEEIASFRKSLAVAKEFFLEAKDITWLPKDLELGKQTGS